MSLPNKTATVGLSSVTQRSLHQKLIVGGCRSKLRFRVSKRRLYALLISQSVIRFCYAMKRPKGSSAILAHRRYGNKSYVISKNVSLESVIVPSSENLYPDLREVAIDASYQAYLTCADTGTPLKHFVPAFPLKRACDNSRVNSKFPLASLAEPQSEMSMNPTMLLSRQRNPSPLSDTNTDDWYPAKCSLSKRTTNGTTEYLVKFASGEKSWEKDMNVSDLLKRKFIMKKANEAKRRQRLARDRFRNQKPFSMVIHAYSSRKHRLILS